MFYGTQIFIELKLQIELWNFKYSLLKHKIIWHGNKDV